MLCREMLPSDIWDDITMLFNRGSVNEIIQVLTVCSAVRMLKE